MAFTKSPNGRKKPRVVSCRVTEEIYVKIPRPVQPWLEKIIIKKLRGGD